MHRAWEEDTAHGRFWRQLVRGRAIANMQDAEYLRSLRYQNDRAKKDQRLFGKIWEEHGTNIYKLIAKAHGEIWDEEDDQKTAPVLKKLHQLQQRETKGDDNVAPTCKGGSREREHKLQGEPQESFGLLEEKGKGLRAEGPERQEESR